MTKTIGRNEIILGLLVLNNRLNDRVDLLICEISEEYGFNVRTLIIDVNHTILLLIGTSQLVLLDCTRKIVLKMAAHSQSILRTTVHRLGIDIITLLVVLHQPALIAPTAEVLDSLLIDGLRMLVSDRIEVDLGFDNVQQRSLGCLSLSLNRI